MIPSDHPTPTEEDEPEVEEAAERSRRIFRLLTLNPETRFLFLTEDTHTVLVKRGSPDEIMQYLATDPEVDALHIVDAPIDWLERLLLGARIPDEMK